MDFVHPQYPQLGPPVERLEEGYRLFLPVAYFSRVWPYGCRGQNSFGIPFLGFLVHHPF